MHRRLHPTIHGHKIRAMVRMFRCGFKLKALCRDKNLSPEEAAAALLLGGVSADQILAREKGNL